MAFGDEARQQNEWSRTARTALLLFLLFMCHVDTTSANDQPHDFSSLPPHIDTTSASSKVIPMAKSRNPFDIRFMKVNQQKK